MPADGRLDLTRF